MKLSELGRKRKNDLSLELCLDEIWNMVPVSKNLCLLDKTASIINKGVSITWSYQKGISIGDTEFCWYFMWPKEELWSWSVQYKNTAIKWFPDDCKRLPGLGSAMPFSICQTSNKWLCTHKQHYYCSTGLQS